MMPSRTRRRSTRLGFAALLGTMFTLTFAATLHAQVLSDPRVAEFDPSPDHWTTLESGEPAVLRYDLAVYLVGASAPFGTVDMGKPSPDSDGKIRYDFASQVTAWTLPGGDYEARVSAVGPEGEALSNPSNPFTFTNPSQCTISLAAPTVEAAASGGSYAVNVSTGEGCGWAATTALSWITVWTASGSGSGTASFEVQANSSLSSRTGTVTIGEQILEVRQAAAPLPCSYTLSPASASVAAAGGSASFTVTAGSGCSWTATPSQSWTSLTVGSGSGTGTVSVAVAANTATFTRTGTVIVEGQTFTITQAAAPPPCSYTLSPASASVAAAGGTASFTVTAGSGCSWTATPSQIWTSLTGGSGSGTGTVTVAVAANTATSTRTGTVSVQGQTFTVTQAAAAPDCGYGVSPTSADMPATGGSGEVSVSTNSGCTWAVASSQSWLVPAVTSGVGSAPFAFTAAPNKATAIRTAKLTVGPWVVTVTQEGKPRRIK